MPFPRFFPIALCCAGSVSLLAQTPVSFSPLTSTSGITPANILSADLNNDGIDDIIQDTAQSPSGFTVSLGNGDGTFKAPVFYKLPSTLTGVMAMTTGDFNNDGKVDLAVMISNTNQIAVYLGNGDGTFPAPKISAIALASGFSFTDLGSAAADFNERRKCGPGDLCRIS